MNWHVAWPPSVPPSSLAPTSCLFITYVVAIVIVYIYYLIWITAWQVGTLYSMAPEVLTGKSDQSSDVWSVGVIAYMLLSGSMPFYSRSVQVAGPTDVQRMPPPPPHT